MALNVVPKTTPLRDFAIKLYASTTAAHSCLSTITNLMTKAFDRGNIAAARSIYMTGRVNAFEISDVKVSGVTRSGGTVTYSVTEPTTGETYSVIRRNPGKYFAVTSEDVAGWPMQSEESDRGIDPQASVAVIVSCKQIATRQTPARVAAQRAANERALVAQQTAQNVLNKQLIDLNRALIQQQALNRATAAAQIANLQRQLDELKRQVA